MAACGLKCGFCRLEILDFTNFNAILWIFMTKTGVSVNFTHIFQATGLLFGIFPWFCQC